MSKYVVMDDSEISILDSMRFDFLKKSRFRITSDFYRLLVD